MHKNNDRIINNEVLPLYCIPIHLCAVGSVLCSNPVVCVCVGQVGDIGQFHAARCPGAMQSGEFQNHEILKHHIEVRNENI